MKNVVEERLEKLVNHCEERCCRDCNYTVCGCWCNRVVPAAWKDPRHFIHFEELKEILEMYDKITDWISRNPYVDFDTMMTILDMYEDIKRREG